MLTVSRFDGLVGGPLFMLLHLLFWVAIIFGIVWAIRRTFPAIAMTGPRLNEAEEILMRRYASGEITSKEGPVSRVGGDEAVDQREGYLLKSCLKPHTIRQFCSHALCGLLFRLKTLSATGRTSAFFHAGRLPIVLPRWRRQKENPGGSRPLSSFFANPCCPGWP